jgi:hypothetical protein
MSEEQRDTSEFDAPVDTVEEEPQQVDTQDEGPYETKTFAELVSDQEDTLESGVDGEVHSEESPQLYAEKYNSVEELESGYMEAQRLISERDDMASMGRQMSPYWNQFQEWMQAQAQEEATPPPGAWNPPHSYGDVANNVNLYRSDYDRWSELPEQDRQKSQEFVQYYDDQWSKWFTNPPQMMEDLATPVVQSLIDHKFQQFEARLSAANFLRENHEELDGHYDEFDALLSQGASADLAREVIRLRGTAGSVSQVKDDNRRLQRDREKLKDRLSSRPHRASSKAGVSTSGHAGKSFSELVETAARAEGMDLDNIQP